MVLQITEGSGETLSASEEVLIDAENGWTTRRMPFFELAFETLAKVALHGGGADLFPAAQAAAVDAVEVLLIDRLLVGFAGPLAGKNAGESLTEVSPTVAAEPLRDLQFQDAGALSPILVADASRVVSFIP